jgi:predicted alpha/beta superfamily hydrolase
MVSEFIEAVAGEASQQAVVLIRTAEERRAGSKTREDKTRAETKTRQDKTRARVRQDKSKVQEKLTAGGGVDQNR